MEKIVDSVQQIISKCDEMLNIARDSEFLDVQSISKTLTFECNELKVLFDEHPENTLQLNKQKQKVERLAIRLEFFLSVRMNEFTYRKRLREMAAKLYEDCRDCSLRLSRDKSIPTEVLCEWGTRTVFALNLYARSTHIIFEISEEENNKIRDIVDAMKKCEVK